MVARAVQKGREWPQNWHLPSVTGFAVYREQTWEERGSSSCQQQPLRSRGWGWQGEQSGGILAGLLALLTPVVSQGRGVHTRHPWSSPGRSHGGAFEGAALGSV